jgi:glycosyltransferase involved in cell wall biosynthesis
MDRHPSYAVGGANRQMALLADQLSGRFRVHYTCRQPPMLQRLALALQPRRHRVATYDDLSRNGGRQRRDLAFAERYGALLARLDADLYHARATMPNLLVAAAHTRQVNRPLVFTIAHWFDCTLEHLPEAQRAQYAAAIAGAMAVTSLTREMQREVERRYDREVVLIPPGHPVPERSPRKADPPLVLWLGRLNAVWRRPQLFVEIARRLADVAAQCLLVGPGSSYPIGAAGNAGAALAEAARTSGNLRYVPGIRPGWDADLIARAAVVVNTSSHEGFPNTFQQAWLAGVPVASLAVDPDRVIEREGLGVCTHGDLDELAGCIARWLRSPRELCSLGERCRRYALHHHDIRRTAQRFDRLYRRLLG